MTGSAAGTGVTGSVSTMTTEVWAGDGVVIPLSPVIVEQPEKQMRKKARMSTRPQVFDTEVLWGKMV